MMRTCQECGRLFGPGKNERPSVFARRKRCSASCRKPPTQPDKTGRSRAAALYPIEQPCEVCGKTGKGRGVIDRHHRNSDRLDNRAENIAFLCRKHHHAAHRLTDGKVGGGGRPRIAGLMHERGADRAAQALALRATGWSLKEIAEYMQLHPKSVQRYFYDPRYSVTVSPVVPPQTDTE